MEYLILLLAVILVNTIPFFMPATWTLLSGVVLFSHLHIWAIPIIGAIGATCGRFLLAKISRTIVRHRFLSVKAKTNIDSVKIIIERRKKSTIAFFLFYAFSPLPSNQLFIAYGLTDSPLIYLMIPFFIGRLVSYSIWTYGAARLGDWVHLTHPLTSFGVYFVMTQVVTIGILYLFTKINWKKIADRTV